LHIVRILDAADHRELHSPSKSQEKFEKTPPVGI
jgi:hypothetical protein